MNWWTTAIAAGIAAFLISRGGLPAILTVAKFLAPFVLFYMAVKHITLLIFPDRKNPQVRDKQDDPDVIRICGKCGKEENSCLKCKVGFRS